MAIYRLNGPAHAGLICKTDGKLDIDRIEYLKQLGNPHALWRCPICLQTCDFNDARYEEIHDW